MRSRGRPETWQAAHSLLEASRSKAELHPSISLLVPAAVALANLVFCAFFEQPLHDDPTDRLLSLFLFIQGLLILLFTLAHIASAGTELLHKSLVMPIPPSARLMFVFISSASNPLFQALVLSDILFLLIVHHESVTVVLLIPLFVLAMAANILAVASVASVVAIRKARPPGELAAYCILGTLVLILVSLYFHIPGVLGFIPPMSWTAKGIKLMIAGGSGLALLYGAASIGLLLLMSLWGRRMA